MAIKASLANDKEIFDFLAAHESLRKLRVSFDFLLGHPVWWISFKLNGNPQKFKIALESSFEIWKDPRLKNLKSARDIVTHLKKRNRETRPFLFETPPALMHFCVPLVVDRERIIGTVGLGGIKKGVRQEILNLLASQIQLIVDNCAKNEELNRLSAAIRPRAIALSTVHTVHRIINSTLNLEELISRLAHLTAQVLRASRCGIYLIEKTNKNLKPGKPKELLCKALVGYPKNKDKNRRIPIGTGIEGGVAKTAQIVLRKNLICVPLIDEDVIGAIIVSIKKDKKDFTYFDQEILTTLAEEAVIAIKNAQLYEEQKKVTLGTIQSLAVILGTRVPTVGSPEIFLRMALLMAEELKLGEEEIQALHYATLLKDTAKIGIPDEILKKPTKLTGAEYQLLRDHPIKGAKIVQSFESLRQVVPIILHLREKYDGTGYPKGLKGDKIPIGSRILSVINAFEAIVMGRPYRDRGSLKEAFDEILKNSGSQFDPKIVEIFIKVAEKEEIGKLLKNVS